MSGGRITKSEVSVLLTPMAVRFLRIERVLRHGHAVPISRLLSLTGASLATVKRDIVCLRGELGAPIEYDPSGRGYRFAHTWAGVSGALTDAMERA